MRIFVAESLNEKRSQTEAEGKSGDGNLAVTTAGADKVKSIRLTRKELRELRSKASDLADRFWFDTYWLATFVTIKRLSAAIGSKELEATFAKVYGADKCIPSQLVGLASQMSRRGKYIPADDLVRLHKALKSKDNKMSRVVLEAMAWERLLVFETDSSQRQQICQQMGIKVPVQSLDHSRKKFAPKQLKSTSTGK